MDSSDSAAPSLRERSTELAERARVRERSQALAEKARVKERSQVLAGRAKESTFVQNVVVPKVVRPIAVWYDDQTADGASPISDAPTAPAAVGQPTTAVEVEPGAVETPVVAPVATAVEAERETRVVGAPAARPRGFALVKAVALRVKDTIKEHNLVVVAAGIAFWSLLAIPAVLTAAISIFGLVVDEDQATEIIEDGLSSMPEEAQSILGGQIESVAGASGGGLAIGAIIGLLLAIWTSSGALAKVIATLNTIWGVEETREFAPLRGIAIALTFGGIVTLAVAVFALAAVPPLLSNVGLGSAAAALINVGRFPLLLLLVAAGLAVLYWAGPNRTSRFRILTWGAVAATILWLIGSGLFTIYTAGFASYNETYAGLGGIVILLLWLFLTAFMVLIGAEIDAAREQLTGEHQPDPATPLTAT